MRGRENTLKLQDETRLLRNKNYLLPLHVIGGTISTFAVRLQTTYRTQHGYFRRVTYRLRKRSEVPIARGREVTQC